MRISILALGVLMLVSIAQAEVISWRVDVESGNGFFDSAQLFATTASVNYKTDTESELYSGNKINTYDPDYGVLPNNTTVSYLTGISFFVKLYNGANIVGYSELKSWSTLVGEGSLASGIAPDFPATAWNAGAGVVPEPTSMALLAMGVSALLMRRKRRT